MTGVVPSAVAPPTGAMSRGNGEVPSEASDAVASARSGDSGTASDNA
jgi:hypothetical protein